VSSGVTPLSGPVVNGGLGGAEVPAVVDVDEGDERHQRGEPLAAHASFDPPTLHLVGRPVPRISPRGSQTRPTRLGADYPERAKESGVGAARDVNAAMQKRAICAR
jgi:hypothetical protein